MLEIAAGLAFSAAAPFLGYHLCRVGEFVAQCGCQAVKNSLLVALWQVGSSAQVCEFCGSPATLCTHSYSRIIGPAKNIYQCDKCWHEQQKIVRQRGDQFTPIKHDQYLDWRCQCGQVATWYEWATGKRYCDRHMKEQPYRPRRFHPGAQF